MLLKTRVIETIEAIEAIVAKETTETIPQRNTKFPQSPTKFRVQNSFSMSSMCPCLNALVRQVCGY